jgi:hypothetical protein
VNTRSKSCGPRELPLNETISDRLFHEESFVGAGWSEQRFTDAESMGTRSRGAGGLLQGCSQTAVGTSGPLALPQAM